MKRDCIIKLITHPYAWETAQARQDYAVVTGQPVTERPWWYKNTETGQLYHDIFGCIGWPTEVKEKEPSLPGYVAVVGVVRDSDKLDHLSAVNAMFQILDEAKSDNIQTLLTICLKLRVKYGFGLKDTLLSAWYGDPDRFLTTLALRNEFLIRASGDRAAILITPPNDFYVPRIFDVYVRSLQEVLTPSDEYPAGRLFFGGNTILKNEIREFRRDNPAVLAIGGLVHTLLCTTMWMDTADNSTMFRVEDKRQYG